MSNRIKHRDNKNALSIVNAAEREMQFTLKQTATEESAFNIIRNIYECFRMLGDALLVSKGIVSQDHVEQIKELEKIPVETIRPVKLIGYIPTKAEAKDAVSIAHACFYLLLKEIKRKL